MKLVQFIVCAVFVSGLVCVQNASAQLLNYKRKDIRADKANIRNIINNPQGTTDSYQATPAPAPAPVKVQPVEKKMIQPQVYKVEEMVSETAKMIEEEIPSVQAIENEIPKIEVVEEIKEKVQTISEPVIEAPVLQKSLDSLGKKNKPEASDSLAQVTKVKNRVEGIYDLDQDGILQEAELQDFLGNVVNTVERRGSFRVSSDILKPFDVNSDGKITRYEVLTIKQKIN